jgi:ABC-type transport system involved in multi-copper enzyme maturation permease subunit
MGDRLARWAEAVASRLFGPVFALDATRVGRRTSTFVARWVYLLILVSVLGLFFYSWWDRRSSGGVVHPSVMTRFAEEFFWVYVVTQFLAVVALTPAFTAAAITDEKERKTLDFLLITTLTGREIVFGKLAVRFGVLLTLVLAGLPIVALMQFFGGIEPRLLFLTVGMTLITVASLSAISICASVLLSRTREAVMLSYGLPAAYVFASLLGMNYFWRTEWRWAAESFAIGNPFVVGARLDRAFAQGGTPSAAISYIVFHAVVAVLGFAIAALRLRASAEGRGIPGAKPRGVVRRFVAWVMARRTEARTHPPVSDQPVLWREVHTDPGGGLVHRLFVVGVLAAIVLPFCGIVYDTLLSSRYYYRTYRGPWYYFREQVQVWVCAVTCGLGIIMMLRATLRGAAAVAGERDRDTWTSLICTPLSTREILHGKWAGCLWGQRDAMYLLGAVWVVGILTVSVSPITLAAAAGVLWVYLGAFAWLGMRCSATARNTRIAIARAVPTAIFLGGGFWFFVVCCCIAAPMRGASDGPEYILAAIAGITPPVVLAGLPALDSEVFDLPRRGLGPIYTALLSAVAGGVGWFFLGNLWSESARDAFNVEANRTEPKPPEPRRPGQLEPWDDEPIDDGSPSR